MRKIRIQNDGQRSMMTKVMDAATGEELDYHVKKIVIDAEEHMPTAIITSAFPFIDVTLFAEIEQVCPCCGHPVNDLGKPL